MDKVTEDHLVNVLFNQLNGAGCALFKEVPHVGQSVDLVALHDDEIIMYEAKLNDWKRAIEQCRVHELVADYIWIAIAQKKCSPRLIQVADELGYGVMIYKRECNAFFVELKAKKNTKGWEPQKEKLRQYFNTI